VTRGEGNGAARGCDWAGVSAAARGACVWAERAFAGQWRGAVAGQGARSRAGGVALRAVVVWAAAGGLREQASDILWVRPKRKWAAGQLGWVLLGLGWTGIRVELGFRHGFGLRTGSGRVCPGWIRARIG